MSNELKPPKHLSPVALDGIDNQSNFTQFELRRSSDTAEELKEKCTVYARSHLPEALRKAVYLFNHSKKDEICLKAIEFIVRMSELDGKPASEKVVNGLRKVDDKQIEQILRAASNGDQDED